jgi:hypothetical protein
MNSGAISFLQLVTQNSIRISSGYLFSDPFSTRENGDGITGYGVSRHGIQKDFCIKSNIPKGNY